MKLFWIWGTLAFTLPVFPQQQPSSPFLFCEKNEEIGQFFTHLRKHVWHSASARHKFRQGIEDKTLASCLNKIDFYLKEIHEEKGGLAIWSQTQNQILLSYGLLGNLPIAYTLVEETLAQGVVPEWLDFLQRENPIAYQKALEAGLVHIAQKFRKQYAAPLQDPKDYGKPSARPKSFPKESGEPLLLQRYLDALQDRPLTAWNSVNILYAVGSGAYRTLFTPQLVAHLDKDPTPFLESLRYEPAWIIQRLLPFLAQSRHPLAKRELVHLSTAAQDRLLQLAASQALIPSSPPL